jgi:hypothetical protein
LLQDAGKHSGFQSKRLETRMNTGASELQTSLRKSAIRRANDRRKRYKIRINYLNHWRFFSSFLTFLSAFFSFIVLAGSFLTAFFVSWLLLMVFAPS